MHLRQIEGKDKHDAIEPNTEDHVNHAAKPEVSAREEAQVNKRLFLAQFNDDKSRYEDRCSPGQFYNSGIAKPVFTISIFEHDFEGSEADRHSEDSPPVTFLEQTEVHRLFFHGEPDSRDQQCSRNDVDVKDERPSVVVGQPAADERPDSRRKSG